MPRIIMIDDEGDSHELAEYAEKLAEYGYSVGPTINASHPNWLPVSRIFMDTDHFLDYFENMFIKGKEGEINDVCAVVFDIQMPIGEKLKDKMSLMLGRYNYALSGYIIADYLRHKYNESDMQMPCFVALTNTTQVQDDAINYEGLFVEFMSKHPKIGERDPPFIRNCSIIHKMISAQ